MPLPLSAHHYIDTHFDEHLKRTQEFLRQPSISAQNVGVRQCADLLRGWLTERGATVAYHGRDDYPILLAEWQVGAPRTLLVYGMYDVQPVDNQPWTAPPFSAEIRDNHEGPSIFARGACNSKGPLMTWLHAIEALRATDGLPVNIKWTIEGEEEIGSPTLPDFYQHNIERLKADAAFEPFWGQWGRSGRPELTLGTKGVVGLDIICRAGAWGGPREVVHSSLGAWVASPAWRLVRALSTLTDEQENLCVDGLPRLGTLLPDDEPLLQALVSSFNPEQVRDDLHTARFKHDLPPYEMYKELQFSALLNINGLSAGYAGEGSHTIIPNIAQAKLDIRLPPGLDVEQVKTALRAHLDRRGYHDLELIFDAGYPAARSPFNTPVVQALLAAYRAHGQDPLVRPIEASATPYYLFTDVLGLPFAWGGLGSAAGSHGPDEWCSVAGLKSMEKSLATFLTLYAEQPE